MVEAKASYKHATDGLQQAKQYAEMLGLKFAYATNGHDIIEFDYCTGLEKTRADYPTPDELWRRYRAAAGIKDQPTADMLLTPFNYDVAKGERYYQQLAVNRTAEAILKGQRRLLLTMATGTSSCDGVPVPHHQAEDGVGVIEGLERARVFHRAAKYVRVILARHHRFGACNEGGEEAIEYFDVHRLAAFTCAKEFAQPIQLGIA